MWPAVNQDLKHLVRHGNVKNSCRGLKGFHWLQPTVLDGGNGEGRPGFLLQQKRKLSRCSLHIAHCSMLNAPNNFLDFVVGFLLWRLTCTVPPPLDSATHWTCHLTLTIKLFYIYVRRITITINISISISITTSISINLKCFYRKEGHRNC